ncbi:alkaline phosphatase-like protein [Ascodesmis nigricans]|uniref:GPI ethanolamine phosphate transferase 2 n=1 Tax=Ascodesmis nigricans TaxID=341454 RepID=A0A4S2MZ89_9PEZI|nr:alkaline phosphatase-like protein [Ascodesmis nigricans]
MKSRSLPAWSTILALNLLLPVGILLFAKGFFPYKPFLPGLATFEENDGPAPKPPFKKLVFMVVDALRSDFVFAENSGFKFTQSLIRAGKAQPFTAHATSPTITMPRVKAITTGSVPGFLDMILSFAESDTSSTLATQDTWLAQVRARGGDLVMYGDDTWLRIFPGMFKRHDGTTSFFVSDFTEVDNNVTRHINDELRQDDWSVMIMHYLGLDHIGHKSGPRSPYMIPKQQEMDLIVEQIFTAIEEKEHLHDTLLVLLGDHGMNDAGNHGGSGEGETSPALVLMSPKFLGLRPEGEDEDEWLQSPVSPEDADGFQFYKTVEQSDIAPSLAGMLGVPISKNNLGVFIPDLLKLWKPKDRVHLMLQNARQLLAIATAAYPDFHKPWPSREHCHHPSSDVEEASCLWEEAIEYHEKWVNGGPISEGDVIFLMTKFASKCQSVLSGVASNYDLRFMGAGLAVMLISAGIAVSMAVKAVQKPTLAALSLTAMSIGYVIMMFASSFVEEEHHFWYWVASAWFMALFIKECRANSSGAAPIFILVILRLVRRWNQTGQKFAGAPDIANTFFPGHITILWGLIIATYTDILLKLLKRGFTRHPNRVLLCAFAFTVGISSLGFKISFAAQDAPDMVPFWLEKVVSTLQDMTLVTQARGAFVAIFGGMAYTLFESVFIPSKGPYLGQPASTVFHHFVTLFLITQTRPANIPLFLCFSLISSSLQSISSLTPTEISVSVLILQFVGYFCFGGTNAISSVDLSNAYNGVEGFNILVVGVLTFVSNWAGPVYWASHGAALLRRAIERDAGIASHPPSSLSATEDAKQSPVNEVKESFSSSQQDDGVTISYKPHVLLMTCFHAVAAGGVMAACWALRTHLFIWTVFSPKYLYAMVWTVLFQGLMNVGWGSVVWWISGNWIR